MKLIILGTFILSLSAFAKEVKDFNKVLIQNVQKDIKNDNIQKFEKNTSGRAPASVVEDRQPEKTINEEKKFNRLNKW